MSAPLFSYSLLQARKTSTARAFSKVDYLAKDLEKMFIAQLDPSQKEDKKILIIGCPGGVVKQYLADRSYDHYDPFVQEELFCDAQLPFETKSYDLIIEGFIFHWINNPLGYLGEINRLLRAKGQYISGFLGGATLTEFRQALLQTDSDLYQGAFARVSPMIKPEAATRLLQASGFTEAIVAHEEVGVGYPGVRELVYDLRAMGESNALIDQRSPKVSKIYFNVAETNYRALFPEKDKNIVATFDFIVMTGWCSP